MNTATLDRKERRSLERMERKKAHREQKTAPSSPSSKKRGWVFGLFAFITVLAVSAVAASVLSSNRPTSGASVRATSVIAPHRLHGDHIVQVFFGSPASKPEILQVAKATADWHRGKMNDNETEMWVDPAQQFWVSNRNATLTAAELGPGDRLLQHDRTERICTGVLLRPVVPDNDFVVVYKKIHGEDASVPLGEPGMYLSKVTQTFQHDKNEVYQIYYGTGRPPQDLSPITLSRKELEEMSRKVNEGEGGSVFVTAEHPYYVLNKSKFVQVGELEVGDRFRDFDGNELVYQGKRLIRSMPGDPFKVYNIEVADNHTYFAGKESVWVHNDCPWPVEKAISAYRVLLDGPASGNKWTAFQDSLRLLLKRGDMLNYSQRRLYIHVLDEFRDAGGLTHQCPRIPLSTDAEHALDEFFRVKKGKWVEPNPMEDAPTHVGGSAEKQFDRVIDGVKTEYYSPQTTDAEALSRNVSQKASKTRSKGGDELVVDITGNPAWSPEVKQRCIDRSAGVAPTITVRFRNGDILE